MTGSDWIANALLFTGQTLAKSISSGSRFIEEKIEPNATCFKLSEQDKDIVDMVYNTTHTVTSIASDVMNKALDVAASGIRTIEPKTAHAHFGWSALKATATLIGGVAAAASVVLDSSREGIVQIVRKKYGDDAGYVAEKTVGTVSHVADLLVYFDAKGISRRVVLGGLSGLNQARQEEREVVFDHNEEAVVKH
ncbi:hypothetical protein RMCBS344292_00512 [Rhizopus microsporus]|nr:hypothetical protein RMCBS344292_00512 [Rhizopus microsporus]